MVVRALEALCGNVQQAPSEVGPRMPLHRSPRAAHAATDWNTRACIFIYAERALKIPIHAASHRGAKEINLSHCWFLHRRAKFYNYTFEFYWAYVTVNSSHVTKIEAENQEMQFFFKIVDGA